MPSMFVAEPSEAACVWGYFRRNKKMLDVFKKMLAIQPTLILDDLFKSLYEEVRAICKEQREDLQCIETYLLYPRDVRLIKEEKFDIVLVRKMVRSLRYFL